ncbi:MAG TPA: hypothetical protein VHB25_20640 [Gemmatimonadaceae bacterium]|nr:hypothetical protein [Gemmatimonadaceae bacterium]
MTKKARHRTSPYTPAKAPDHASASTTRKSVSSRFGHGAFWIAHKLPIALLYGVGLYFNVRVFQDFKLDTTSISNAAFAALGALAALCFSAAPVIDDHPDERRLFAKAGERYMYAAFIMLVASLLKYAYIDAIKIPAVLVIKPVGYAVESLALFFVPGLFFRALLLTHDGTVVLNRLYLARYYRDGSETLA